MMKIISSALLTNDVVCYVTVILTNQKYPLNVFSPQLITLRGIFMLTPKRGDGLVDTAQDKQNTLSQHVPDVSMKHLI